jgi:RNA polymerase sigma-70 factor, ECF subfamily
MDRAAEREQKTFSSNDPFSREDPTLVASARAGDCKAFDVLASTYRKRILNIALRITRNHDDAEDVTQRALMKAFLNVRGFKGTCAFITWLKRIAINEALMLKRRLKIRPEVGWQRLSDAGELGIPIDVADARPNPEQCFEMHEWRQMLLSEIKQLTPKARSALETRCLNECSMKDLAVAEGISLSAAKSRLFRSRSLLRDKFTQSLNTRAAERVQLTSFPA